MAFTKALYYPSIDIQDDGWLKTSALFWDQIQTIVPFSIENPYNNRTAKEFEEIGILKALRVESEMQELEDLSDDVLRYLTSEEAANLLLSTDKRKHAYLHIEKMPRSIRRFSSIHPEKMAHELRYIIEQLGLSRSSGEFMEVDSEFASFYMTLLATRLSERLGIGLLTDSNGSHRLSSKVRADSEISSEFRYRDEYEYRARPRRRAGPRNLVEGMIIDLIVEQIGIDPKTPTVEILEFRDAHRNEIGKFRTKLEELTRDIPENMNIDSLRQYVSDKHQNEVVPAVNDLKDALSSSRITWISKSWLKVSFLSVSPSLALIHSGLNEAIALLVGAGISLIGMGTLYSQSKANILRENPFSYVVAIQKKLT